MMIPGLFKVDIFHQIRELDPGAQFVVVHFTREELEKIKKTGSGKEKSAAHVALQMIDQFDIHSLPDKGGHYADDEILIHAKEGYAVATMDKAFKERLKSHKIEVITLRQKSYVKIV